MYIIQVSGFDAPAYHSKRTFQFAYSTEHSEKYPTYNSAYNALCEILQLRSDLRHRLTVRTHENDK